MGCSADLRWQLHFQQAQLPFFCHSGHHKLCFLPQNPVPAWGCAFSSFQSPHEPDAKSRSPHRRDIYPSCPVPCSIFCRQHSLNSTCQAFLVLLIKDTPKNCSLSHCLFPSAWILGGSVRISHLSDISPSLHADIQLLRASLTPFCHCPFTFLLIQ